MARIASLLPAATEIVDALGAGEELVAVSHECDHPGYVTSLPRVTRSRLPVRSASREIDASVREIVQDAGGLYELDVEALRRLRPDVVVTQSQCEVCAVTATQVEEALRHVLDEDVVVVDLQPSRLADVLAAIERVGRAVGRDPAPLVGSLRRRLEAIAERAGGQESPPRVVFVEWMEPVHLGGAWIPDLVAAAGGIPLGPRAGCTAAAVSSCELSDMSPEAVVVAPCGFDLERTLGEADVLRRTLPWEVWPAVRAGRVFAADGNALFSRPGPRLVDSVEALAAMLHPDRFGELADRHRGAYRRIPWAGTRD